MATFSPLPSPPRYGASLGQGRPSPQRRVFQGSRRPTPARGPSLSAMEVEENHSDVGMGWTRELYAKTEQLSVSFYADLPVEVRQVLSSASAVENQSPYYGTIDTVTGFAIASSSQACFVWQHTQTVKGIPTCYIFSTPCQPDETVPPFSALVPYGPSREPGLLLLSSFGEIRFWDSIGLGLAGADHYSSYNLGLEGEVVTTLIRVDPQLYIASTDHGHLIRIHITSAGGKHHLTIHPFTSRAAHFSITGLIPSFFGGSSSHQNHVGSACITSVALGSPTNPEIRDLWVLIGRRMQLWSIATGGREDLVLNIDVAEQIQLAIEATLGISSEDSDSGNITDLELLDLAVDEPNRLALLVSFGGPTENAMDVDHDTARRAYNIIFLSREGNAITVQQVRNVLHESTINSNAPIHPRLQIANGHIMIVQFGDALGLVARDSDYSDRLALKGRTDQTIGVGVLRTESSVLVLTTTVMMEVKLNLDEISIFDVDTGRSNLIRSVMTQAILYGSNPVNPLQFTFPPEVDEDSLMSAAEQLSAAVLRSDPEITKPGHDLDSQMSSREERLVWLIRFINDNGALGKMAQRSRQRLAFDAEKLYSSHQLWLQQNDFLQTRPSESVLTEAIASFMSSSPSHGDALRAFFRYHLESITQVLQLVQQAMDSASRGDSEKALHLLPEANSILLIVINSALEYREHNIQVYGVTFPMSNAWTSESGIIDITLSLFDSTVKYLDSARMNPNDPLLGKPKSQLPELAAVILGCIRERLDWLSSDPSLEREKSELVQKYLSLRPDLMNTLCRFGFHEAALTLAEKDRDFTSLAALCHRETIYPPEANPFTNRIQRYIDTYKEDFTVPLFQWYIQHGELRLLFSSAFQTGNYLERFFAQHSHPGIAWLHSLRTARYGDAAELLKMDSQTTQNLGVKHFELSLGKLAYLAQSQDGGFQQTVLDGFHNGLDFISVHSALVEQVRSVLAQAPERLSVEARLDFLVQEIGSGLSERPFLATMFKDLIHQLLSGNALSDEDLVDLLTLKDNHDTPENFDIALSLVEGGALIHPSRLQSTLRTIWRRIYIQDEWNTLANRNAISDTEINQRLQHTAAYFVLAAGYSAGAPHDLISPNECLIIPGKEELSARWPGLSQDQLESLEQDLNFERDVLGELEGLANQLGEVQTQIQQIAGAQEL